MKEASLYWDDVHEGEPIRPLALRLTVARMIAATAGTGNLAAVHHNREFAQAAGNKDMFVDTMFMLGVIGRAATDWSGPQGFIRRIWIRMRESNYPSDVLRVSGRVTKRYAADGQGLADLEMECANERGVTTDAEATVELPTKKPISGEAIPERQTQDPGAEPPAVLPQVVKELVGRYGVTVEGQIEVNPWMITQFCEPLEDTNPVYHDLEFANSSRFGGIISPPALLGPWATPRPWPHHEQPRLAWDLFREVMGDYPFNIVASIDCRHFLPARIGDRVSSRQRLASISPLRQTRLGVGYFYVIEQEYLNQRGGLLATHLLTQFRFRRDEESLPARARRWDEIRQGDSLGESKAPLQQAPDETTFRGFIEGFVKEWAGPGSTIKCLAIEAIEVGAFSLNGIGETVTFSGEIVKKEEARGERLAYLRVVSMNGGALTSRSRATVVLPNP